MHGTYACGCDADERVIMRTCTQKKREDAAKKELKGNKARTALSHTFFFTGGANSNYRKHESEEEEEKGLLSFRRRFWEEKKTREVDLDKIGRKKIKYESRRHKFGCVFWIPKFATKRICLSGQKDCEKKKQRV